MDYQSVLAHIRTKALPVLFIDTCIFLDIIRTPVRDTIKADTISKAKTLLNLSTNKEIWLVTSKTVQDEWYGNVAAVVEEVEREILKLEQKRIHFLSAAKASTGSQFVHGQNLNALNLEQELKSLSEAFLAECMIIKPQDSHMVQAMNRVKQNRPPAKRGKAEAKDCEIYETFLHLCKDLRGNSFEEKLLFVSSNTHEYSDSNSGGIQPELTPYNGKYISNLPWAQSEINSSV